VPPESAGAAWAGGTSINARAALRENTTGDLKECE